jgi:hypothetical protein
LQKIILEFAHAKGTLIKNNKKENQIFPIYKEILSKAVAKSYMNNGLLVHIWGNISSYIRKPFLIYDFPTAPL